MTLTHRGQKYDQQKADTSNRTAPDDLPRRFLRHESRLSQTLKAPCFGGGFFGIRVSVDKCKSKHFQDRISRST